MATTEANPTLACAANALAAASTAESQISFFPALQGLRFLIALSIMANHWADHSYESLIPQQQLTIDIFFMIEGFLAAQLLARSRATKASLVGHRLLEIYPLYMLGLLAGVATALAFPEIREGWSNGVLVRSVLAGAVGAPAFSVGAEGAVYPLNWPSWALVLEFYIFSLLCLAWRRLNVRRLAVVFALAAVVHVGTYLVFRDLNMGWRTTHYAGGFARVCFGFAEGALLYRLSRGCKDRLPRLHPVALFAAYIGALFIRVRFVGLPLLLVAAPALVLLTSVSRASERFNALCRVGGRYAYGIYFLHFPVIVTFKIAAADWISERWVASVPSFVLATALVVGSAYLAVRFYDAPLRGRIAGALWPQERPA